MIFDVQDPSVISQWEMLLRLLIASVCGGTIGFERTYRQKEAGLRTHLIVALASALMMLVSKYAFFDMLSTPGATVDVSRVAANIITGISFLGAGVIFIRQELIRGLTTAAGVWATTGVGLAVGAGMYTVGLVSTAMLLLFQFLLPKVFHADSYATAEVAVTMPAQAGAFQALKSHIPDPRVSILSCTAERGPELITFRLSLRIPGHYTCDDVLVIWGENTRSVKISST